MLKNTAKKVSNRTILPSATNQLKKGGSQDPPIAYPITSISLIKSKRHQNQSKVLNNSASTKTRQTRQT